MIELIFANGLLYGGVYASLAVGFSLIFGVARILNMAHTAFYMVASFLIYTAIDKFELPLGISILLTILLTVIIGMLSFKFLFNRIREHETAVIVVSVALAMLFQETLLAIFGDQPRGIPPFVSGFVEVANTRVTYQYLMTLAVSVIILATLWLLLWRTKMGLAIRAISQDSEIANVMGIDVGRICMITMGISVAFAAMAGIVTVPIFMLSPLMWIHPLVIILAIVVLGGLGSIKGSVIGAFILGFAETAVIFLVPGGGYLGGTISLCVMVLVLVLRPEGLFGVVFEEDRL